MSWSQSYSSLAAFERDEPATTVGSPSRSVIDLARQSASHLIKNKIVGDSLYYDFTVNLSGHENPYHRPVDGMANDTVTITLTQKARSGVEAPLPVSEKANPVAVEAEEDLPA